MGDGVGHGVASGRRVFRVLFLFGTSVGWDGILVTRGEYGRLEGAGRVDHVNRLGREDVERVFDGGLGDGLCGGMAVAEYYRADTADGASGVGVRVT